MDQKPRGQSSSMPDVGTDGGDSGAASYTRPARHQFNEQTNYVSRRTIITVNLFLRPRRPVTALTSETDLLGLRECRLGGPHGSDHSCGQPVYHRQFPRIHQLSLLDHRWIFHVGRRLCCPSPTYADAAEAAHRRSVSSSTVASRTFGHASSSCLWDSPSSSALWLRLSPSPFLQLTVFRAFTGIGGGGLMTVAQLIVSDVVPLRERGKYQGIMGAVVAIANGIGPVVGGALSSQSADSWRWIFRLNLPLTILTASCVLFFMPLKKVQGDWKLKLKAVDFVGTFLSLSGMAVFILGLTWGGREYAWNSAHVVATLVVGSVVSAVFVLWQWKVHIFASKIVNGACLTMAINGWNFVMQVYYVPAFYQLVYGYSATKSGAMLLPITILQTASSTLSGLVVHWTGCYRECILFGWACWAIGLGLMSTLDETTAVAKQIGYAIIIGIDAGVERREMAVVTSFRNFVRNLGSTLGLTVSGTIINNVLAHDLAALEMGNGYLSAIVSNPNTFLATASTAEAGRIRSVLIPAYQRGFRTLFIVGASLALLAFVLAFWLMPQVELTRPDDAKLKEAARQAEEEKRQRNIDKA